MPIYDYETEQDKIKRARAQAAALRTQWEGIDRSGQMVSGRYVKPPVLGSIVQMALPLVAGLTDRQTNQDQAALGQRMTQDYSNWMSERPQTKVVQTPTEVEAPGPQPEELQGTPLTRTIMKMEKQAPTDADQIAWASRGVTNPLSRTLAQQYLADTIIKAPEREEARAFKAEEARKVREANIARDIQRHQDKLAELDLLYADKTKTRDQQLVIEKMKDATKRELGLAMAKARVDAAHERATAAGANVKPVPNNIISAMSSAEQAANGFDSAFSTYKPEYGGLTGQAKAAGGRSAIGTAITEMVSPETAKEMQDAASWWRNYENQAAMVKRHELFGSAFTKSEQAAWDRASIKPGDPPEFIAASLKEQARLANIFYNRLRDRYTASGHVQIGEAFPERSSTFEDLTPNMPQPRVLPTVRQPTATPRRRSTDLPPGVTLEVMP